LNHLKEDPMSDFQNDMNQAVQGFVAQITELARRAAITTLSLPGRGYRSAERRRCGARRSSARGAAKRTAADPRRCPKVRLVRQVQPGLRIEYQQGAGTSTKELALRSAS
jgi:hypothetical protein